MLNVKDLTVGFKKDHTWIKAVNQISFSVKPGQIIGIVGESGCGKSTALFSILGLISNPGKMLSGELWFEGNNIAENSKKDWTKLRGKDIAMIFQDPMSALNPAYSVGEQIREMLKIHGTLRDKKKSLFQSRKYKKLEIERVVALMKEVRIPMPEERYHDFPHQFSGGMQQRIIVAMAIANNPKLLLADEPTTALDVTIQAQILEVLKDINRSHNTSIITVTHDLSVASEFCDEIIVMYAGRIVEKGPTSDVIENPQHPYTKGLLNSIPVISENKKRIEPIKGNVIDLAEVGEGCGFYNRCPHAVPACMKPVEMVQFDSERQVRCILFTERGEAVAK
ncbi:ABC transporter ATP-binding protein [Sporosarcina sp. FA9]|uniref:ABC transporter ATP-binding protein n=1 Tax=Sporosarcina sp. FA9 TaxID=3413030 RepID=UPI003F65C11B